MTIKNATKLALTLAVMLLALPWHTAACAQDAAQKASLATFNDNYDGEWKDHPNLDKLKAEVRTGLADFPAAYKKITGLAVNDFSSINVSLIDQYSAKPPVEMGMPAAMTGYADDGSVRVEIHVRAHIGRPHATLKRTVIHEMTHAVQRRDAGAENWDKHWPQWLREGIAVYVAGEIDYKVANEGWIEMDRRKDPISCVAQLDGKGGECYPTWALHLAYLDSLKPGKLGALVEALTNKQDSQIALRDLYGITWAEFTRKGHQFALDHFATVFPQSAVEKYHSAKEHTLLHQQYDEAVELLEQLRDDPQLKSTSFHSTVLWDIAWAHIKAQRWQQGYDAIVELLMEEPDTLQYANAFYKQFVCLQQMKKYAEAIAGFERVQQELIGNETFVKRSKERIEECRAAVKAAQE